MRKAVRKCTTDFSECSVLPKHPQTPHCNSSFEVGKMNTRLEGELDFAKDCINHCNPRNERETEGELDFFQICTAHPQ